MRQICDPQLQYYGLDLTYWAPHIPNLTANISFSTRRMDHSYSPHNDPQNPFQHNPWRFPTSILDPHQHLIYVWFLHHVPLCSWSAIRVQCWSVRQFEYVGANG